MMNLEQQTMKPKVPNHSKLQRATKRHDKLRRNWCRRCRFRAPSGQCLDTTLRSGRCGDWVYYLLRGHKQFRRRWVRPKDPRTLPQIHNRVRLGTASCHYSARLTEEERDACIAAGANRQSRPRLGQSGPLTGQQYLVRNAYAKNAAAKVQSTKIPAQVPRPQKVTRPTWEHYRSGSGVVPVQRRRGTGSSRTLRARLMQRMGVRLMPAHRPTARPCAAPARAPGARFDGGNWSRKRR